jgi:hypothetical protein
VDLSRAGFSGPLLITHGGTYSGKWQSLNPDVAAITVRTQQPVVITDSRLRSRGDLITGATHGIDLTVTDTVAQALPPGSRGKPPGRFISLRDARHAFIAHNQANGTGGIRLEGYGGGRGANTFQIIANRVNNIDGRISTGDRPSAVDSDAELVSFVQFVDVHRVPGMEVAWNDVRNEPRHSRVEDVVNVYRSSGTPTSPILIRRNFINGAYPTRPASNEYSGGGVLLGDGDGAAADSPAYVIARHNVVLNTSNYGIGVAAGRHMRIIGNCVLAGGRLPDGRVIKAQNVGIYVKSMYGQSAIQDVALVNNVVRWQRPGRGELNNFYIPDATKARGNSSYRRRVTGALLTKLYSTWRHRAHTAGVEIGSRQS